MAAELWSEDFTWLPLISDYTRETKRPVAGTVVSAAVYALVSVWMYALGMLLARGGSADFATGIAKTGLGWIGLVIVAFSTVTTTFLDNRTLSEVSVWPMGEESAK